MNQNYQDQLRSLSRSINDELRLLSRTINDDKNKNDNKTNKHISTLLEGKSKTQVKNNSRKTKKNNSNQQSIMNQNYQDQLRSLSRSINDELRLLSRTINDDKNKNDNKMNKHIATLLEGKSKTQVKNNSRNYCGWTKEEDAIIISNKNDKKTNKHIATLLEGKSESQVQYHSAALIEKGTLKTLCLWTEEEDAIIISNKNEKKTIKHIATLLEGKSVSQIKYRSAALIEKGTLKTLCLWTEEEDAIIISNKNDKKTNKHIATLLEGKSESQINYRSAALIEKGTLKTLCLWTEEEDAIIISNKNEKKTIKHIATLLEGKSFIQVNNRSRFLINKGTLKTGTLKTVAKLCLWTKEEDDIIISNKKDNKTNMHIATLLEGKSETQVRNHYYFLIDKGVLDKKGSMWTKEDDAIIISNKNDKKTNKHIATLLEGRSESQVQYRSASLIEKGTLKMVAKKKKAPVIKTRIAPKASKFRFTVKQKYKPTSNKKQKLMDERVENLSEEVVDSKNNCIPVCTKSIYNMPSLASNKFHQNPPPPDSSDSSSDNDSSDNDSSNDSSSDESSDGLSDDEDDHDNCIPVCTTSIYDMPSSVSDIFHLRRPILSQNQLSSKGIIPDGTSSLLKMPSSVSDKFHLHLSSTKPDDDFFGFNFDFENDSNQPTTSM